MNEVERAVRALTKAERRDYLRARGWRRIGRSGAEAWVSPDPDDHHCFYSLAAAIRTVMREESTE